MLQTSYKLSMNLLFKGKRNEQKMIESDGRGGQKLGQVTFGGIVGKPNWTKSDEWEGCLAL